MFKRNQVEEAIINVWGPEPKKHAARVRNQIKRLLETDRSLSRDNRSTDPACATFAFYSEMMPGKGRDNTFSSYEAFAITTALGLMRHGWSQSFAVTLLRQIRRELETEYARIAKQDPEVFFDSFLIKRQAKPGSLVVDNSDPVFLGILSPRSEGAAAKVAICRSQEALIAFLTAQQHTGHPITALEVATTVHVLAQALCKTGARRRGRQAAQAD